MVYIQVYDIHITDVQQITQTHCEDMKDYI